MKPTASILGLATGLFWLAAWLPALAGAYTGTEQSSRLYTAPDPAAGGGLHARVINSPAPILQVFAMPADKSLRVYKGAVEAAGREFSFRGLPVAKYDLVLVTANGFIEGLTLTPDQDTLTEQDRRFIAATIMKSNPFFDTKQIHRCGGGTGDSGKARCVLQEVRTRPVTLQDASVRADIQVRSLKLALLEDVGAPGWELTQTREVLRTEVAPGDRKGILPHAFNPRLGGIRITDSIKELGDLDLAPQP